MTQVATERVTVSRVERPAFVRAIRDALAVTQRNLIAYRRVPQLVVFSTIQPVIFVVMFRYVFGGAIGLPVDFPYVDFLMPGVFVQTVVFGALATAIGLATDMKSGLMERFRSLPMARSAVLAGRTLADLVLGIDTDLTRLPWVGHRSRRWEVEPLRWLAVQGIYGAYRAADRSEGNGRATTSPLARVADLISGH